MRENSGPQFRSEYELYEESSYDWKLSSSSIDFERNDFRIAYGESAVLNEDFLLFLWIVTGCVFAEDIPVFRKDARSSEFFQDSSDISDFSFSIVDVAFIE